MFNSQSDLKKIFRYCLLRQFLLSTDTSGLYPIKSVKSCATTCKISYNTLRRDIAWFAARGLLIKANGFIKLNTLKGSNKKLYNLFIQHETEIRQSKTPAIFFSDLYKKRLLWNNVILQAKKEAAKHESHNGKKLLKIVRNSSTVIGENQGIYLSLNTIGKILGRSKTTAFKYIDRLHKSDILPRRRRSGYICHVGDPILPDAMKNLYGRLFIKDGQVYQRLQNGYIFN
jgi:Fic family protein